MSKSIDTVESRTRINWLWRRPKYAECPKNGFFRIIESAFVVVMAALACLALGELALRITLPGPLLQWRDFRKERAAATINHLIQYDSVLGWRLKSFIESPKFNTLEYGFRSNGSAAATVTSGGVLAVGSSFTVGSGVMDAETWPAHLQQLTGWNVNNAGEGAYQADQIVLLAEQLLPLVRPQVLVVDLIPDTIIGTGYASFGWPKPYFTIDDDLVAHNSPVPHNQAGRHAGFDIRPFLGHFAVIDRFMAAFFANLWFTADGNSFVTVSTDEVGVTCRLLERLKQKTDAAGVRLVLYLQYGGLEVVNGSRMAAESHMFYRLKRWLVTKLEPLLLNRPPRAPEWYEASARVGECSRNFNITVADELASLTAVYEKNPDVLRKYYQIEPNGAMGHKSSLGNLEVAKRVAATIGNLGPANQTPK